MKAKAILIFLMVILLASFTAAYAREHEAEKGSMKSQAMKEGKMKKHLMQGMIMHKMMEKQMVATKDGGVIILVGNQLLKYDKNLNLVKETEIKIDFEAMKKKMKEMKECFSKQKEMVGEKEDIEEKTKE